MKKIFFILIVAALSASCVSGRLPDPVYVAIIKSLTADEALSVKIDEGTSIVTIDMDEAADVSKVNITSCSFNNDSLVKPSIPLVGRFDLNDPLRVILTTYQDYEWYIMATQTIIRNFSVKGQVGASVIDVLNHRVFVTVSKTIPLTWLTVTSCKLGPHDITTYSVDPYTIRDFSNEVKITVSYRDVVEEWTILAKQSDVSVNLRQASARARSCYFEAEAAEGGNNGFVYRPVGGPQWLPVDSLWYSGGALYGYVASLQPSTVYHCKAFSGQDTTEVKEFTTTAETQIPNGGLNVFEKVESSSYYSFYDPADSDEKCRTKWWDSGNMGSTTIGEAYAITVPDTKDKIEGKASTNLISRFVIVKFAAGNLFCGEFAGLVGTSGGIVHFGRPFTERPNSLKVWIKYENGPIDEFNGCPDSEKVKLGDPDIGQIYIALGDWDPKVYGGTETSPVEVNTTVKSSFFNPDAPAVIAYGTFKTNEPTGGWQEVEIPLEYRDYFRIPTHIIISCASSCFGDYFTGSTQSKMWVDDFRLVY